jgi:long-chain acyl-CoA synthetase
LTGFTRTGDLHTTRAVEMLVNFATLLRMHADATPDAVALRSAEATLTWTELDARVTELADALLAQGLPPSAGHPARVAIALPNDLNFAVALLAVSRAGLIAVPVNPGFTARELRHVLTDCGAELLIGTDVAVAAAADAVPRATTALTPARPSPASPSPRDSARVGPSEPADAATRTESRQEGMRAGVGDDAVAVLLYTSGTEGAPKGAMLTHRALSANHEQLATVTPALIGPSDVVLLAIPLFHAYGLNTGLGSVLWHGASGVLLPDFDPAAAAATVAEHGVTVIVGVPPMYVAWSELPELGASMRAVRLAVSGAAPLSGAVAARFAAVTGQPVQIGYGLTETAPVLTSTVMSRQVKAGSIGRPLPGVELRLVGASGELWRDGTPAELPDDDDDQDSAGEPGEIVVRGANLFRGYWPDGRGGPDAEGWWPTGDIAYADEDGDLFLVDRLGELILVSGFNVYPAEIEQVLTAHPGVAEAAALAMPHAYTGQTVRAVVVRSTGSEVTEAELAEHCARNLARFKQPTVIEFAAELPHSAIGKVRKSMLRQNGAS